MQNSNPTPVSRATVQWHKAIEALMRPLWTHEEAIAKMQEDEPTAHCWRYDRIVDRRDEVERALGSMVKALKKEEQASGLCLEAAINNTLEKKACAVEFMFRPPDALRLKNNSQRQFKGWYWGAITQEEENGIDPIYIGGNYVQEGSWWISGIELEDHKNVTVAGHLSVMLVFDSNSGRLLYWDNVEHRPEKEEAGFLDFVHQEYVRFRPNNPTKESRLLGSWVVSEASQENQEGFYRISSSEARAPWRGILRESLAQFKEKEGEAQEWVIQDEVDWKEPEKSNDFYIEFGSLGLEALEKRYNQACISMGLVKKNEKKWGAALMHDEGHSYECVLDQPQVQQWIARQNKKTMQKAVSTVQPDEKSSRGMVQKKRL